MRYPPIGPPSLKDVANLQSRGSKYPMSEVPGCRNVPIIASESETSNTGYLDPPGKSSQLPGTGELLLFFFLSVSARSSCKLCGSGGVPLENGLAVSCIAELFLLTVASSPWGLCFSQRVQVECHYGIRSPKPYHIWLYEP